MVATVLELLDALDHARGLGVVQRDPRVKRSGLHGPTPGELRDQQLAVVTHHRRVDVLERGGVDVHARDVHPALVREGVAPHVRLVGVRCEVQELVEEVCGGRERCQLRPGEALVAELEL